MENLEHQASVLFGEKEYSKALEIYSLLLQGNPKAEKYAVSCGNCYDALGNKEKAIEFYNKALKINRNSETAILNLSTIYYEAGDYEKSASYAQNVIKINEKNISAWQNLANIHFCKAQYDKALTYYQKMYEYNPNSYIAMINIANTYFSLGKYVMALEFARKSLDRHPSSITAHMISGNALAEIGKYEKAIEFYLRICELDEHNTDVLHSLSETYHSLNDWENCLIFAWRYLKFSEHKVNSMHLNFGYLLYECYSEKSTELAQKFATKWLKKFPENKIVKHMAEALLENSELQNSAPEYIKETFNTFAPDFEDTLSGLDYQAPELIAQTLTTQLKKSIFSHYNILDLGCGTGLCGEKIKSFASHKGLIGVDLSENMLKIAENKKIYAQLICDDICNYLETCNTYFQVITASDVWTYYGDLTKAFVRVSKALLPDGIFAFTISENTKNDKDFFLTASGRFIHSIAYVEKVLKSSGLRVVSSERHILRNEADTPVYGYVITARKPNINKQTPTQ